MLPADRALLERVGARVRELREANSLTQEQLGERAGFGAKYIGEIEKGLRDVPLSTLRAVVENGLGMELDAVFGGKHRRLRNSRSKTPLPRDVELTAALVATLPLSVRRPLLALAKAVRSR